MILYSSNAIGFKKDTDQNLIVDKIENSFVDCFGKFPSPSERKSWNNSMQFMEKIIRNSNVANDCGVLIEYNIPTSSKRVDFILSGKNESEEDNFVIVELKQWEEVEPTEKEDIVKTFVGKAVREAAHPSYQAWSYQQMIHDMNMAVYEGNIQSHSCSYLHNYKEKNPEPLKLPQYSECISQAPVFLKDDYKMLEDFLFCHVGRGKGMEILYRIESGKIKPSKKLIDCVSGLFQGNKEFILIDEQKVAFETIVNVAKKADGKKRTIIVTGGPGTGKSVISMNAFGELLKNEMNVQFVAPNSAFRNVLLEMLTKQMPKNKNRVRALFSGSARFYNTKENIFDVLIVDEAHRLKGAGAYQYMGKNQIEDIIKASRINVFFVDDSQQIRPEDIGSVQSIKDIAQKYNSEVEEIELKAQFRCSGAEGFMNWLTTVLQIEDTANFDGWDKTAFEFKIADSPTDLLDMIKAKNYEGYKARMLAGYSWKWSSEKEGNKNGEIDDVVISECDFSMPWNSRATNTWAIDDAGVNQIGCVHTSQGLEFDYVGVIVGNDLKFNPEMKTLYASYNDYKDLVGKKGLRDEPVELTRLVSNVYKILMSRGMKGCYVYCRDPELQEYFKERLEHAKYSNIN
ncbi:DUF2075 domain-containing protein [Methanolapillus millepedarum]|uniref:Schlafen group 3-like DNA/RNA helicase domain-containing protein n=1 Tax=Methanolapillus millepedarum TaxID=3028296 RepID=A0AA96V1I8_9EURY|nr:hypothetical protein MsAc7_02530 [Methanosarcinaceae archaeon Ac7]